MNKVAIGYLTKDKVELSRRTIEPLLQPDKFDLFWFDGSTTSEGVNFFDEKCRSAGGGYGYPDVRGGPDAAVVRALTTMLHNSTYTHVGIVENDVLLHKDWFAPTFQLFERGASEGLTVGAVSARCYQDRILIQRDGYAVCHNLGWGQQIMTREAATLALAYMRTGWTLENRRTFAQLSGLDLARWWAFGIGEHFLCADWGNDRILAANGLASLALVPSPVEMIGQDPPLEQQGLMLATEPFELLRNDLVFKRFSLETEVVRLQRRRFPCTLPYRDDAGCGTWFAHQVGALGASWRGDWRLHWHQGFGPFVWKAGITTEEGYRRSGDHISTPSSVTIPISGPCQFLVSGGAKGGKILLTDEVTGFEMSPVLSPEGPSRQITQLVVPRTVGYGPIKLTALSPGVFFYGVRTQEPQPVDTSFRFDHSILPPV